MREIRRTLGIVSLVMLGTACVGHLVYASGSYRGRVTDAETQEPLVGAVVLATWYREIPVAPHGPARDYIDVLEVLTDAQGEFTIPERTHVTLIGKVLEPKFIIYYPAYVPYPDYQVHPQGKAVAAAYERRYFDVRLLRLKTRERRMKYATLPVFTDPAIPEANISNLLRLVNTEIKALGLQPIGGKEGHK